MLCVSYTNAVFQLIFLMFLHRFMQNCLCAKMYLISNIDICSLLVRIIDCVAMKPE